MENISQEILKKIYKGSPSSNIYENFDKNEGNYIDDCNVMESLRENVRNKCKEICKKIVRNMKYLSTLNTKEHTNYCLHYKYWLYYKIEDILSSSNNVTIHEILNKFINVQLLIAHKYHVYNCFYDLNYSGMLELKEHNEKKYLHDYFENHKHVKKNILCDGVSSDDSTKYLNYIKELYDKYKKEENCCDYGTNHCPNYFNCYEGYDPNYIISLLNHGKDEHCSKLNNLHHVKDTSSQSDTNYSSPENNNIPRIMKCIITQENKNEGNAYAACYKITLDKESYDEIFKEPDTTNKTYFRAIKSQDEDTFFSNIKRDEIKWKLGKETLDCSRSKLKDKLVLCKLADKLHDDVFIPKQDIYYGSNTENSIKSFNNSLDKFKILNSAIFRGGTLSALALGTIIVFTLYYKFTPFGYIISKNVLRKSKIKHNDSSNIKRNVGKKKFKTKSVGSTKVGMRIAYHSE
ncbi:variable surface protein [Plasmodium gonderi]|uniref:Variable surface protein n=1 Tax=Plasmodium gonderi TaxID=77519 RepID=A0A1Y1JRW8_PLAGO|nr:variable surface protein [Plasmodium gonderi]GAW82744.1 variable surface protein [Plasmodium gonderi]